MNASAFTVSYVSQKGEAVFCVVSGHEALERAKDSARCFRDAGCTEVRITAGDSRGMRWLRDGGKLHYAVHREDGETARWWYVGTGR